MFLNVVESTALIAVLPMATGIAAAVIPWLQIARMIQDACGRVLIQWCMSIATHDVTIVGSCRNLATTSSSGEVHSRGLDLSSLTFRWSSFLHVLGAKEMSEDLQDELTSISAIYGGSTLVRVSEEPAIYALSFPSQPAISLRVEFPTKYPDAPPSILGTQAIGNEIAKGEGAYLVELVRDALSEVYTPGAPCIFDLVEEVDSRLRQLGLDQSSRAEEQQALEADGQHQTYVDEQLSSDGQQPLQALGEEPLWTLSDVITEKKSVFIARAAAVSSIDQAKDYLGHLLVTDKKVAKATHNITAWRIQGRNGVQYQDCDDDGETAAGGRLLHLLEVMGVWNAMVVVSRWYGGVQLGPDRFRIINQTARDALVKGSFAPEAGAESGKKKGKK